MSFRLRLTIFFALIVALPMIALAILVSQIASDSATGKVDARLESGLQAAAGAYSEDEAEARAAARRIAARIAADDGASAELAAPSGPPSSFARRYLGDGVAFVEITDADGNRISAGSGPAIAGQRVDLVDPGGSRIGSIEAATTTSAELINRIRTLTGEEVALIGPRGPIDGTVTIEASAVPDPGETAEVEAGGDQLRAAATEELGAGRVRVSLFAPTGAEPFLASRPTVAIGLLVFFVLALAAVALILRSLQGYIREMLGAARRIGGGDFSKPVPVAGGDELAGLASEFNQMTDRLSEQMDQLRRQRREIESSVRRIGEAFASGLDRHALLAIVVETAVGATEADFGLVALSGHVGAEVQAGAATEPTYEAALAAEQRAMKVAGLVEVEAQGAHAIASSMGRLGGSESPMGAMTVAREGRPFSPSEREVFLYLLGQASSSIENVALHELVSEQAVTDDLTGLANRRAFRDTLDREAARAKRFGHELSLMILDLDDFKGVNDTHGHPQGDAILRAIGRVLRFESRAIDHPARYGGEEFIVALPETDAVGAFELAERIRAAIAEAAVPLIDGDGEISVTASIGLATLPGTSLDVKELLAAADRAMYDAKRRGKDRVCAAGDGGERSSPRSSPSPRYERRDRGGDGEGSGQGAPRIG